MNMFSESHCHLRSVTEDLVKEAEEAGVELVLTAGIDVESSEEAVKTASRFGIVKGCVGIHPWYADSYDPKNLERLRDLAGGKEVVAVSEIGLDFTGRMTREWVRTDEYVDPGIQRMAFRAQLGLAKELGLPVLVHDRAPGQEILEILEEEGIIEVGAAIHGFTKGPEYAGRAVEVGVYLSIGRGLLREENKELEEAIRQTPLDRLLTETDSGDPKGVILVAGKIAELKGLYVEEVGAAATRNLKKLLGI
jgi:TatD DNase family protein